MKKKFSSILVTLTLFVGLSGTALADTGSIALNPGTNEPSSGIELQAEPCGYYPSGQHSLRLVGSKEVSRSGGEHQAIIWNSDRSQTVVNCNITNWYESKAYACACGNASQTVEGSFIRTTHQYNH